MHVPAPRIFSPALGIIVAVVLVSIFFPVRTGAVLAQLQTLVVAGLGPYYLVLVAFFVIFAVWMGLSRFGDIKLGLDDDPPEFGLMSWFASASRGPRVEARYLRHVSTHPPNATD